MHSRLYTLVDTYTGSHLVREVLEGGERGGSHALLAAVAGRYAGCGGYSGYRHGSGVLLGWYDDWQANKRVNTILGCVGEKGGQNGSSQRDLSTFS